MSEEIVYESKEEKKEIPQDLQEKINALRAVATSNRLITEVGQFSYVYSGQIAACSAFLKDLYARVAEDALAHEAYETSEDLVALKKEFDAKNMAKKGEVHE